jgi:hypothetical protein
LLSLDLAIRDLQVYGIEESNEDIHQKSQDANRRNKKQSSGLLESNESLKDRDPTAFNHEDATTDQANDGPKV